MSSFRRKKKRQNIKIKTKTTNVLCKCEHKYFELRKITGFSKNKIKLTNLEYIDTKN